MKINNASKGGVKVIIKNLQKKIPIDSKRITKTALKALSSEGIKKSGEITVLFVNDKRIREFNLMYRGYDCPTDVISFDNSQNKKQMLADIVISTDTAVRNAKIFKTTPKYELKLYVIHALLHLLGYNDETVGGKKEMQTKAESILSPKNVHTPH